MMDEQERPETNEAQMADVYAKIQGSYATGGRPRLVGTEPVRAADVGS